MAVGPLHTPQPAKNQGAVAGLAHEVLNVDDAPEEDATLAFTPFGYVAASSEENVEWLNVVRDLLHACK